MALPTVLQNDFRRAVSLKENVTNGREGKLRLTRVTSDVRGGMPTRQGHLHRAVTVFTARFHVRRAEAVQ